MRETVGAPVRKYATQVGSLLALAILWQVLVGRYQVVPYYVLPPPTDIVTALVELLGDDRYQQHIYVTLRRMFIGGTAASAVGILLGLAMGWSQTGRALVFPLVSATYPLPKIALLPLFLIILGTGEQPFLLTIGFSGMFLVMFNSMRGVDDIGNLYFDVAQDYGVTSSYAYFREVLFPGALPMIFTGLRLTLNVVLIVTIGVEFVAADWGLGVHIWTSYSTLQTSAMYASIVIIALMGVFITYGLAWATDYAIPWKSEVEIE